MKVLLEKVTELGIDHIFPVITENTNIKQDFDDNHNNNNNNNNNNNDDESSSSFQQILIQSSEQSERITIPKIHKQITPFWCYFWLLFVPTGVMWIKSDD